MDNKCTWPLGNGKSLMFTIYYQYATWNHVAGIYIFARPINNSNWQALYIGKTDDFSSRIPNHEQWNSAIRLGATHVHALVVPQAATRDTWEKLLIAHLQPSLNEQYKGLTYLSALRRS